ncbi:aminodeoxychorismate lyase ABZ2 Ecym_4778 [Eremothecium cymbalariae DBVPG|uniref:Aminodeoxychorismate lyase n=1 Tax=Eremothecium cymbalariae (strain CBS 270.75 / DBVPG 7215 / KCTC 17166 / NRRL Y-17582) TaxID=931890 RepID=G8JSR8_ERECY|nr:hypothetical protein Ecym_4778 [Eremothecium cymbalariae DBVPG\
MSAHNTSVAEVVEYVKKNIIDPNFENVEEFEILSTIRYDPNLTHVLPVTTQLDFDIRFDFLKNDSSSVVSAVSGNVLFNEDFLNDGNDNAVHDPLSELLFLLEQPLKAGYTSLVPSSSKMDLKSTYEERFFLLKEHHQRLNLTMSYFDWDFEIPFSLLLDKLIEALPLACAESDEENISLSRRMELLLSMNQSYKMRVLISRGGNMKIEAYPLQTETAEPNDKQQYFINTLLSGFLTNGPVWDVYIDTQTIVISPFTTFKTTKRQHYNESRTRMTEMASRIGNPNNKTEILVYNEAFQLLEGSITSVAVKNYINEKEYRYVAPFLASGCLCGVMRHFLIQKGLVQEEAIDIRDISVGDEVLIFNSVMGCVKGIIKNNPTRK